MLKLRTVQEEDLENIMNWRMKKEVTKYMYTDPILDIEKQKKWFKSIDEKKDRYWIITFENVDIGLISINNIDEKNKRCSWAYYIADIQFRGKGIARDLECNIYDYVFLKLKLNKLTAEVFEFNENVIKIHEKFGSKIEGRMKEHIFKNDKFYNVVILGILKAKWLKIRSDFKYNNITI